jgi:transcriptional regulator with XRE-family HTH domain
MLNRVKEIRKLRGLTQEKVAEAIGKTKGQISKIENGGLELTAWWIEHLAKVLGCMPADIISDGKEATVLLVGNVGENGKVTALYNMSLVHGVSEHEQYPPHYEFVEVPPEGSSRNIMAVRVNGNSLLPHYPDGTIFYYSERIANGFDLYFSKLCVVQLLNGMAYIASLKPGHSYNRYNLVRYNANIIEETEIAWCAKVIFIKMV